MQDRSLYVSVLCGVVEVLETEQFRLMVSGSPVYTAGWDGEVVCGWVGVSMMRWMLLDY